jgi:hypothetical protein
MTDFDVFLLSGFSKFSDFSDSKNSALRSQSGTKETQSFSEKISVPLCVISVNLCVA